MKLEIWVLRIMLFIIIAVSGVLLAWWITARDLAWDADRKLGACIDKLAEKPSPEVIRAECPEYEVWAEEYYREDLPIYEPAILDIKPIVVPEPVCKRFEYYFSNEVCIEYETLRP